MLKHLVRQGECLTSIAAEYGLAPDEIWQSPNNKELVAQRRHSGCLNPGDELVIPDHTHSGAELALNEVTELYIVDTQYRLIYKLVDDQLKPIKNIEVRCTWLGQSSFISAVTDGRGRVEMTLPMAVEKGMLAWEYQNEIYLRAFDVGTLLPEETEIGMQQRLGNILDSYVDNPSTLIAAWADEMGEEPENLQLRLTGQA